MTLLFVLLKKNMKTTVDTLTVCWQLWFPECLEDSSDSLTFGKGSEWVLTCLDYDTESNTGWNGTSAHPSESVRHCPPPPKFLQIEFPSTVFVPNDSTQGARQNYGVFFKKENVLKNGFLHLELYKREVLHGGIACDHFLSKPRFWKMNKKWRWGSIQVLFVALGSPDSKPLPGLCGGDLFTSQPVPVAMS